MVRCEYLSMHGCLNSAVVRMRHQIEASVGKTDAVSSRAEILSFILDLRSLLTAVEWRVLCGWDKRNTRQKLVNKLLMNSFQLRKFQLMGVCIQRQNIIVSLII